MMKRLTTSTLALAALVLTLPAPVASQVSVEAQIASQIADRMPQGAGTEFAADVGQLHCWSRVTGGAGETIQHVWIHDDMEFPVSLEIGGTPWRTWSTKAIPSEWVGQWRVEIRDGDGNVLETLSFTVGT